MVNYVLNMVEKFGNSTNDEWYILVPSSEVDGISEALADYVSKEELDWLEYDIQPLMNSTDYIVRLSTY